MSRHKLSPTVLKCETTLPDEQKHSITITSSGYPFEQKSWHSYGEDELREVTLTVSADDLNFTFRLLNEKTGEIKKEDEHECKPFEKKHLMMLKEILDLVEDPTTTFHPQPYKIVKTA